MGRGGYRAEYPTCINGHEFTEENTRTDAKGYRYCRACHRDRMRRKRAEQKNGDK